MSLITRCPACRTMFKVVPDQLRISEGWVRCGKCEEIFDAAAQLQESASALSDAATAESPDTVPFEGALAAAMASGLATQNSAENPAAPVSAAPQGSVDFELKEPQGDLTSVVEPAVASSKLSSEDAAHGVPVDAGLLAVTPGELESVTPSPPPAAKLSFMRDAKQASRWHRPLVRATLIVACLLLVLGLVLQLLVHERDRLAAVEPGFKPLIEEVCLLLECTVRPLRQIESVVIDSSAFSKVKGDVYRLSLTLKNTAPIDLAMPAVELALTDTLDHALVRRVFLPADLGTKTGVISAASETQATLVLTLKANGNGERVAGYRLLAFYP